MTIIYRCHEIPKNLTFMLLTLLKSSTQSPGQQRLSREDRRRGGGKAWVAVAACLGNDLSGEWSWETQDGTEQRDESG